MHQPLRKLLRTVSQGTKHWFLNNKLITNEMKNVCITISFKSFTNRRIKQRNIRKPSLRPHQIPGGILGSIFELRFSYKYSLCSVK